MCMEDWQIAGNIVPHGTQDSAVLGPADTHTPSFVLPVSLLEAGL